MKILIIGMGYAGNRYLRAFKNSPILAKRHVEFAYHSRENKNNGLKYYDNLEKSLHDFDPTIVVLTVTDGEHFNIIKKLSNFDGFVICEKPLVNRDDDLNKVEESLGKISGFCMDMVERYSPISLKLKKFIQNNNLNLLRANFFWGKDRIYDPRPTSGISSEIIHALDLIQWISGEKILVKKAIAVDSDFAVGEEKRTDSIAIIGKLGSAVCSGYSSFVNIVRQRTIDFIFSNKDDQLIFAHMVFDTPSWDMDYLKVWVKGERGEALIDFHTDIIRNTNNLHTIVKLTEQVNDILRFVIYGYTPNIEFTTLHESIDLQKLLNTIHYCSTNYPSPSFVFGNKRSVIDFGNDLESLG